MKINLILIFTLVFLSACQNQELQQSLDELQEEIKSTYDNHQKEVSEKATEELVKYFAIEYKVVELSAEASSSEHEEELNKIGEDRWDCFWVEKIKQEESELLRFYCRRKPKSYLRYLTHIPGI